MKTPKKTLITLSVILSSILTLSAQTFTRFDVPFTMSPFSANFYLDLDEDHENDFVIFMIEQYDLAADKITRTLKIRPLRSSCGVALNGSGSWFASSLEQGSELNENTLFGSNDLHGYTLAQYSCKTNGEKIEEFGDWIGTSGNGLGLCLDIENNLQLGWLDLNVNSNATSVSIKGYGYSSDLNAIIIGTVLTTNEQATEFGITIQQNEIIIKSSGNSSHQISVFNLEGKIISALISQNKTTRITTPTLAGIYLVVVQNETDRFVSKVCIQ